MHNLNRHKGLQNWGVSFTIWHHDFNAHKKLYGIEHESKEQKY